MQDEKTKRDSQTEEDSRSVSDCVVMGVHLCVNPCNWVNTIESINKQRPEQSYVMEVDHD